MKNTSPGVAAIALHAAASTSREGGEVNIHAGYATQEVTCDDCCAEWDDQYKLVGYN